MLQVLVVLSAALVLINFVLYLLLFLVAIGLGEFGIVLLQPAVNVFDVPLDLLVVVVVLLAVLGAQLGAITCNDLPTDQVVTLGQLHRGAEHAFDGLRVVLSEIGDGVVVGIRLFSSHISSKLRPHSRSSMREERMRFM